MTWSDRLNRKARNTSQEVLRGSILAAGIRVNCFRCEWRSVPTLSCDHVKYWTFDPVVTSLNGGFRCLAHRYKRHYIQLQHGWWADDGNILDPFSVDAILSRFKFTESENRWFRTGTMWRIATFREQILLCIRIQCVYPYFIPLPHRHHVNFQRKCCSQDNTRCWIEGARTNQLFVRINT